MPTPAQFQAFADAVTAGETAIAAYNSLLTQGKSDHDAADTQQAKADTYKATAAATDVSISAALVTVKTAMETASAAALAVAGDSVPPVVTGDPNGPLAFTPAAVTVSFGGTKVVTLNRKASAVSVAPAAGGSVSESADGLTVTYTAPASQPVDGSGNPVPVVITATGTLGTTAVPEGNPFASASCAVTLTA